MSDRIPVEVRAEFKASLEEYAGALEAAFSAHVEEWETKGPAAASLFTANMRFADVVRAVNAVSDRAFRAATESRILAAIVDLGRRIVGRHAPGREFDPVTNAVRDYMERYTGQQVAGINETTKAELAATLFDGLRREESSAQLQARVRRLFGEMSAGRARVIALTEANSASAFGALQGMLQAGVRFKGWATQRDDKVRDLHQQMDGQIRPVGDPFDAPNGEQGLYPGASTFSAEMIVNCRCFPYAAEAPSNLQAMQDPEGVRRRDVHERRMLAGVRIAFREQQSAVLAELGR